jgi:hypothetical protein
MREPTRRRWVIGGLFVLGAAVFGAGINWGLPSRAVDPLLFGPTPIFRHAYQLSGIGIERLAGDDWDQNADLAADVAMHPIVDRSKPVVLLENPHGAASEISIHRDEISRARILRRYRLYSYQPDEMITFRALAMMRPGKLQFDPKLYQYGGLWIYPVGAILKAGSLINYVTLTSDRAQYLDSPAMFGRFYILARAYSAAWGLVGMLAVLALVRRWVGGWLVPAAAAVCFICLPVVVDLAHEAKPHLAGTSLLLLAVLAADRYVRTGRWNWVLWTAVACGASAAMVLSGAAGLVILPVMSLIRRDRPVRFAAVCVGALLIAAAIYFAANPYVAIHLAGNRAVLESNFANTRAMYKMGPIGPSIVNAARLVAAGMAWPLAIAGACAAIALSFARRDGIRRGWPLGATAAVILMQFVAYAWNKPGEYARFALFVDVALMVAAFVAVGRFIRPAIGRAAAVIVLVACAMAYSIAYERGFLLDSQSDDSRMRAGAAVNARLTGSPEPPVLYVTNEPAPYCVPPVNLFRWRIVLLPSDGRIPAGAESGTRVQVLNPVKVLDPSATPISWADKSFEVQ